MVVWMVCILGVTNGQFRATLSAANYAALLHIITLPSFYVLATSDRTQDKMIMIDITMIMIRMLRFWCAARLAFSDLDWILFLLVILILAFYLSFQMRLDGICQCGSDSRHGDQFLDHGLFDLIDRTEMFQ